MGKRRKIPRSQLVFGVAEHPAVGLIGMKEATLGCKSGDARGGGIEQTAKSLLAFPELLLRLPQEIRPAAGIKNGVHFPAGQFQQPPLRLKQLVDQRGNFVARLGRNCGRRFHRGWMGRPNACSTV